MFAAGRTGDELDDTQQSHTADPSEERFPDALPVRSGLGSVPSTAELWESIEIGANETLPGVVYVGGLNTGVLNDEGQRPQALPRPVVASNTNAAAPSSSNSTAWTDASLLLLWQMKTVRKKGYEPMLEVFQGHTVDTLHQVWRANRVRCEELGAAWKAAGRPAIVIPSGRSG